MQLYIGNKNYSSWSMRPWVLMTQAGIAFDEVLIPFDGMEDGSPFRVALAKLSPAGRVPVLVDDGLTVWDTLAIADMSTSQRSFPQLDLWPADRASAGTRPQRLCRDACRPRRAVQSLRHEHRGLTAASRCQGIDEVRGEFAAIDTALARLQPGDLCLVLVDQGQEALEHLSQRVGAA
jgi:glutathione S-transferase